MTHRIDPDPNVPFTSLFAKIGLLSFGGPAAQIALMQTELVERHKLMTQDAFLRALSFCMLLPGPEAMQLATYAGWRMRGVKGGLIAGGLFVLPGACVIAVLAALYLAYGTQPLVQAALVGVQAAVIAIVIKALIGVCKRALRGRMDLWIAAAAFVAIFAFQVPFPAIIAAAALFGAWRAAPQSGTHITAPMPPLHDLLRTISVWGALWIAPLIVLWIIGAEFLLTLGLFFAKLATVTFGGAYAVLAYMTQAVVNTHGWIDTPQMIDALGLAETTPGPLILVTEFVAILAGAAQGGAGLALAAGLLCLWVTFIPCFLWIFAGAPYIERLSSMPRLSAALSGVTAAVVGVIANLAVWFALHVLFATITPVSLPFVSIPAPVLPSAQPLAWGLVILSSVLLIWRGWGMSRVLTLTAVLATGVQAFQTLI